MENNSNFNIQFNVLGSENVFNFAKTVNNSFAQIQAVVGEINVTLKNLGVGFAEINQSFSQINNSVNNAGAAVNQSLSQVDNSINSVNVSAQKTVNILEKVKKGFNMVAFNAMIQGAKNTLSSLGKLSEAGMEFESTMAKLQAVTGVTGDKFNDIAMRARDLAKTFGGDAAAAAQMFTDVLSRIGPQIADSPEALNAMGTSIMTLSKTMGRDVQGTMDALTTSMLQYNVSIDDPIKASEAMRLPPVSATQNRPTEH
ncbi:MAG: hypothetical protein LBR10_12120 [Prevotellaceae bacterium]|jgi:CII-binding regulator of phage lambda lysogenization HflD|nr:hypothetical protein [Prevotellaceae bacterium]